MNCEPGFFLLLGGFTAWGCAISCFICVRDDNFGIFERIFALPIFVALLWPLSAVAASIGVIVWSIRSHSKGAHV